MTDLRKPFGSEGATGREASAPHRSRSRHIFAGALLPVAVGSRGRRSARTYAQAGVNVRTRSSALTELLRQVTYRPPSTSGQRLPLAGHYAGLVRIGRETLAVTTDTVGTKVLLAEQLGRWDGIGEDLVAVNVNDLAAVGARPCGLVDVISCRRPEPRVFAELGRGLNRGLRKARCALLGGETAIVPELVTGVDAGGMAIGFFPRGRQPVTGSRIRPGDVLLGLPSTGFHANGYTLIRRILGQSRVKLRRRRPQARVSVGHELLRPSRIYVGASEAVTDLPSTTGLAHITGGGVRNLVRLRPDVAFVLDGWPAPAGIFRWIAELGHVSSSELYQTFNMGIGFVVAVRPFAANEVERRIARSGYPGLRRVGTVERGRGVSLPHLGLRYDGYA